MNSPFFEKIQCFMKIISKLFTLLLLVAMSISYVSCGGDDNETIINPNEQPNNNGNNSNNGNNNAGGKGDNKNDNTGKLPSTGGTPASGIALFGILTTAVGFTIMKKRKI